MKTVYFLNQCGPEVKKWVSSNLFNVYNKRWREEGFDGSINQKKVRLKFINDTEICSFLDLTKQTKQNKLSIVELVDTISEKVDIDDEEEEEYINKDPVRKFQFDHNVSTCLTNKFPDMMLNDEGEEYQDNDFLSCHIMSNTKSLHFYD